MNFKQYKEIEPFERRVHALDAYFKGLIDSKYQWSYTTQKNLESINIKECLSGLVIHYHKKHLVFYVESESNATRSVALIFINEINSLSNLKSKLSFIQEEIDDINDKKDGIYAMLTTIKTILQQ